MTEQKYMDFKAFVEFAVKNMESDYKYDELSSAHCHSERCLHISKSELEYELKRLFEDWAKPITIITKG